MVSKAASNFAGANLKKGRNITKETYGDPKYSRAESIGDFKAMAAASWDAGASQRGYADRLRNQQFSRDMKSQTSAQKSSERTAGMSLAAQKYGADKSAEASMFGASKSAKASMHGADKSAQASMYGADRQLDGVRDTNRSQVTMTGMQQAGENFRTGMVTQADLIKAAGSERTARRGQTFGLAGQLAGSNRQPQMARYWG